MSFHPDLIKASKDNIYYNLVMFPYPSGYGLHVGHASNFTVSDVNARFHRMQGKVVFNPIGFDSFGLPTENYAMKLKKPAYEVTKENTDMFLKQLKALDMSFDYERVLYTSDPNYYKRTQRIFSKLYEHGLVYRDELYVNRCPTCQTVLANDQVVEGACERCKSDIIQKKHPQRFIKITDYADRLLKDLDLIDRPQETKTAQKNRIGRSEGAEIDFEVTKNIQNIQNIQNNQKQLLGQEYDEKTEKVIGEAIKIHKKYKDTITEKQFQKILVEKIKKLGYKAIAEKLICIQEEGIFIGNRYIDIVVDDEILIELKKSPLQKENEKGIRQLRNYLDLQAKGCGLLFNISSPTLTIKRLNYYNKTTSLNTSELSEYSETPTILTVFTTRPDTIYGATALVLAPENTTIDHLISPKDQKQLLQYRKQALAKTAVQRQQDAKDKTGVFSGVYATHPLTNEVIPIRFADYVLAGYGTGAIMIVPAHDQRDREFAKKFKIPIKQVIKPIHSTPTANKKDIVDKISGYAFIYDPKTKKYLVIQTLHYKDKSISIGPPGGTIEKGESLVQGTIREIQEETGYQNIKIFEDQKFEFQAYYYAYGKQQHRENNATIFYAELGDKKKTSTQLTEHEQDYENKRLSEKDLEKSLKYYRTLAYDGIIKAYTGDGILINSDLLNDLTTPKAISTIITHLEKIGKGRTKITYKLRDRSVSRQRYRGSPIPIYYDENNNPHLIPESELPVLLPLDIKNYKPKGKSPLADHPTFPYYKKNKKTYLRECDTLDTFMCSSFYFLRYPDTDNTHELIRKELRNKIFPIPLYCGGKEHTVGHLLYSRFIHKFLFDIGYLNTPEPFQKLIHQGMVLGSDGRKMSKRRGNVIDPLEVIKKYEADAVRTYLMFMGPVEQDKTRNDNALHGIYRFLQRVKNLTAKGDHFTSDQFSKAYPKQKEQHLQSVITTTHKTIKAITGEMQVFKYNTCVSKLMVLVNAIYEQGIANKHTLESLALMLAPFATQLASSMRKKLGHDDDIHYALRPIYDQSKISSEAIQLPVQINGKMRGNISIEPGTKQDEILHQLQDIPSIYKYIENKAIKRVIFIPNKIINIIV